MANNENYICRKCAILAMGFSVWDKGQCLQLGEGLCLLEAFKACLQLDDPLGQARP